MTTRTSKRSAPSPGGGATSPPRKKRASKAVDDPYETIPLVMFDGTDYTVPDEAVAFLNSLGDGPLAVASLAGPYRSGKSLLLNRVVLDAPLGEGFTVGGTIQACTKGLHICKKLLPASNAADGDYQVLVLDTEGLGDVMASTTRDARIFSLALLLSSLFIYNSKGTIDQMAIETLGLVANISNHIRASSEDDGKADLSQFFPGFMWIVRDFALELVDEGGSSIDQADYLERALIPVEGADPEKNKVRNCIRSYFRHRDCATLVRPCADEKQLQKLNSMPFEDFRPEFQAQARALRKKILEQARPKQACGTRVNGPLLAKLAQVYCKAINSGKAPAIKDSWTLISADECQRACHESMSAFERVMVEGGVAENNDSEAMSSNQLETLITQGFEVARDTFKRLSVGDMATTVLDQLRDQLRARGETLRVHNRGVIGRLVEAEFNQMESDLLDQSSWADVHKAHDRTRDQFFQRMGRDTACQAAWNTELGRHVWNWAGRYLAHLSEECKVQQVTVRSLEDRTKAAERDRDRHDADMVKLRQQVEDAQEVTSTLTLQLKSTEGSATAQAAELAQLQQSLNEVNDQHLQTMQTLQLRISAATEEASQASVALETLRSQHGEQAMRLEETDQHLQALIVAHDATKAKLAVSEERAALADSLFQQRSLNERNIADLKTRLDQEAAGHHEELTLLYDKSRSTIADLKQSRDEATARLKAAEAKHMVQHEQAEQAHRAELQELRQQHGVDLKELQQKHGVELKAVHQQYTTELKEARQQHTVELREYKQQTAAEINQLSQQLKAQTTLCASAEARVRTAETTLETTARQLDQLKTESKDRVQELKQQMTEMAQKSQKQIEDVSQAHREELRLKAQKTRDEQERLFHGQMEATTRAQKAEGQASQAQSLLAEAREALAREREKFREGNYQARITELETKLSSERTRANMLQQNMDLRADTVDTQQQQISDLEAKLRTIESSHRAEIMTIELRHEHQLSALQAK